MPSKTTATKKKTSSKKATKKPVKKAAAEKPKKVAPKSAAKVEPKAEEKLEAICVIRVRGAHGMRRTILRTLQLFNLHRVNSATVVLANKSTQGMLQKAKDYIAYGPIDTIQLKRILAKRALLEGNKPLTDDHVRNTTVYKTVDELAKAIYDGKIRIKEVKALKPVFRLHPPKGGYKGSIKKAVNAGGVLGNVGEKINEYLVRMI